MSIMMSQILNKLNCLFIHLIQAYNKENTEAPPSLCEGNQPVTGGFPYHKDLLMQKAFLAHAIIVYAHG